MSSTQLPEQSDFGIHIYREADMRVINPLQQYLINIYGPDVSAVEGLARLTLMSREETRKAFVDTDATGALDSDEIVRRLEADLPESVKAPLVSMVNRFAVPAASGKPDNGVYLKLGRDLRHNSHHSRCVLALSKLAGHQYPRDSWKAVVRIANVENRAVSKSIWRLKPDDIALPLGRLIIEA